MSRNALPPRPLFQGQLDRFCAVYAVLALCLPRRRTTPFWWTT